MHPVLAAILALTAQPPMTAAEAAAMNAPAASAVSAQSGGAAQSGPAPSSGTAAQAGAAASSGSAAPSATGPQKSNTAAAAQSSIATGAQSSNGAATQSSSAATGAQSGSAADTAPAAAVGLGTPALDAPGGLASAAQVPSHPLEISGYAILGGAWTQSDQNLLTVGRNNGFALGEARLEVTGRPTDTLWLYLSFEGAAPLAGTDPVAGRRGVELRDAYGVWSPGAHVRVQAGQFKAPQDVEELLEETEIKFAQRSIVSQGTGAPFGYDAQGLALDRQLGLAIGTDRIALGTAGLTAQLAVMNGNGQNQQLNDTQYPSAVARVAVDLQQKLSLGVDGYFQPRGSGTQPSYVRDNVVGVGADARYQSGPLHLMLLAQLRNTHHVTLGTFPDERALGLSAEGAWKFPLLGGAIEPAVRVSHLDPSDKQAASAITWITGGVNLYPPHAPARLTLDFTHRMEESGKSLDNDGVELAAQVRF
jgi:hypothetical protein